MILPTKHTNFSQSLLGLGAYILSKLNSPKSVDELWRQYQMDCTSRVDLAKHTFDNLVMALIFLYSANVIIEQNGIIQKCD